MDLPEPRNRFNGLSAWKRKNWLSWSVSSPTFTRTIRAGILARAAPPFGRQPVFRRIGNLELTCKIEILLSPSTKESNP